MSRRTLCALTVCLSGLAAGPVLAQPAPIPTRDVRFALDSGVVQADGVDPAQAQPVYFGQVTIPGSPWLRLRFDDVLLAGHPALGTGSYMVITSARDGGAQLFDALSLHDWNYTTAVFNGDTVTVEIYAYPGTGPNRLQMSQVWAGEPGGVGPMPESICGPTDDRVLSSDPRQGRIWPVGCTAWLITNGNCSNRFLTAGHCISAGSTDIVQFNVPLSTAGGGAVAPPPQDQFAIVGATVQSTGNGGVGNDAAQFFTSANSTTGLHARVHMGGGAYNLAAAAPGGTGQTIRITGYGSVSSPVSPTWNLVQKTHTGPYAGLSGNNVRYTVDTTGGNSGSPVVTESDGLAIGVHTHAGCTSSAGTFNNGTAIQHPTLQGYLNNPLGTCVPMPPAITPKGGAFAEGGVADHFNRANGPIGSDWTAVGAANLANFTINGNRGAHTGGVEFIMNDAFQGDHRSSVVWVNAIMNGTGSQFVAVASGMGGTEFFYAKVQAQTSSGKYSHIAFYRGSTNSPWTGGLPFTALGANEFDQGRIRLSVSPDGDTAHLDIDTNFDGVPEFTYSSSGLNGIASGFGKKFGLGAWQDARYDNWNATHDGNTDNFNRANGAMSGPWASSAGTFANFSLSGNAGTHASSAADIMRYTGTGGTGAFNAKTQWVDVRAGTGIHYVALCAGLGGTNNLFVKIQNNGGANDFDRVFFYQGNNGGGWTGMTPSTIFNDLAVPVNQARVRLSVSADGDRVTFDVDRDFDGVPDESFTRSGLNNISASFGNQFGIGAFGNPSFDNYTLLNTGADTFTRPNGAIGGKWAANAGPIGNFSVSGNAGAYTGGASSGIIQNNGWKAAAMDHRQWIDVGLSGTSTAFVALCGGLGDTDNYFVKVQQNSTGSGFNTAGFYRGNNSSVWGITGGAAFFTLTTPFNSGRIRVTVGPDGDSITLDIDRDFDGIVDESHTRGGLASLKAGFGNRFGIGAFGPVTFDNWNATPGTAEATCYPDCNGDGNLNLADFGCFQTKFALGDPYADCNGDGNLNLADFGCFQTKFALGCP